MISANDIIAIIKEIDNIQVNVEKLDCTRPLVDQGIDSLGMISLLYALEERYGFKITETEVSEGKLASISTIVEYVNGNSGLS